MFGAAFLILGLFSVPTGSLTLLHGLEFPDLQVKSPLAGCKGFQCVQQYVGLEDSHYSWEVQSQIQGRSEENNVSWTGHVLNMTSQQWLTAGETSQEVWRHPLTIIVPDNLKAAGQSWTTLLIGGSGAGTPVQEHDGDVSAAIHLATRTGLRVAVVGLVSQPMSFAADPSGLMRDEEAIKAFSWRNFLDHPDRPELPIELPILKAVVRAMDTVTAFTNGTALQFITTGCSKRGLAAVMAGAYDERVKAIAPCCTSLDSAQSIRWATQAMGSETSMAGLKDYVGNGIPDFLDSPQADLLFGEIDPIWYVDRLKKPQLWLSVGRDDFFMVDHTRAFWDRLPSGVPKLLSVDGNLPHTGKLSKSPQFMNAIDNFVTSIVFDVELPVLKWSIDNVTGIIHAQQISGARPRSVNMWQATTCGAVGRRDFRLFTLDPPGVCSKCGIFAGGKCSKLMGGNYASRPLTAAADGSWQASVAAPAEGSFTAFFIEFEFDGIMASATPAETWALTTEASVVPVAYPNPPCHGSGCHVSKLGL